MTTSLGIAGLSRRAILAAPLALPVVAGEASEAPTAANAHGRDTLVAYYSRTGNTRVIAGQIQRARNADLFEIRTATPYPEDYEQTVEQARRETEAGFEPSLRAAPLDMARHRTIHLGFPIWRQTAPPAIRSFLRPTIGPASALRWHGNLREIDIQIDDASREAADPRRTG